MRYHYLIFVVLVLTTHFTVQAQIKPENVFPDSTKAYFSVPSVREFAEKWQSTELGKMLNDPMMSSFREELRTRINDKWLGALGLGFDDLTSFPEGNVAGGLIAVPGKRPGLILVAELDAATQGQKTLEFISKIGKKLEAEGAKKSTGIISEGSFQINTNVYTFPTPKDSQLAPTVIYLVTQNFLVITDQNDLARLMVTRLDGRSTETLAEKEAFQKIMARTTRDDAEVSSHLLKWYVEPLELSAAIQLMVERPKDAPKPQVDVNAMLVKHGLQEVQGAGGVLDIATDDYQLIYKTFFYAPMPRQGAIMKMLSFPNEPLTPLPGWVPDSTARYSVFHLNIKDVFNNIGPVFNDLAQETAGVWEEVLGSLKDDPYGPKIDIEQEFINLLNNKAHVLIDYEQPLGDNREKYLIAIEIQQGQDDAIRNAIEKFFGDDPNIQRTEQNGYVFWQIKPQDMRDTEKRNSRNRSTIVPRQQSQKNVQKKESSPPLFPDGAVTVGNGHIFLSNHKDYLIKVLGEKSKDSLLSQSKEYQAVNDVLVSVKTLDGKSFLRVFSRSADIVMPSYEMIRKREIPKSRTLIAWFFNNVLASVNEQGERVINIDTSKMPEFDKMRHYFGTAGMFGVAEENGWYTQGFQLRKTP